MTVKKKYSVGDTVWIYGITKNNIKSTQGNVIKIFTIDYGSYNKEPYYLVEVPTEIEPLLEVRTWHTISQTKDGHVGSIRDAFSNPDAAHKMLARTGVVVISDDEEIDEENLEDPSPEEIHAALEQSQKDGEHGPLVTKPNKARRPYYKKKKA